MIPSTGDHGLQPLKSLRSQYLALLLVALAFILPRPLSAPAQDAASADRNPVNTRAQPGGMLADSPVEFPTQGALPARFPSDLKVEQFDPGEPDYYLFESPERSLAQVNQIQAAMPPGRFTPPPNDWRYLTNTRRILTQGGQLRLMAIGDSIVNDTMRSGWLSGLRAAYPMAEITATVYVRGGGGAHHFRENDRLDRQVVPRRPDLVFLGGISQRSIAADLAALIEQLRAGLPEVEIVLGTGAFGTTDPRDASALAAGPALGHRRLRSASPATRGGTALRLSRFHHSLGRVSEFLRIPSAPLLSRRGPRQRSANGARQSLPRLLATRTSAGHRPGPSARVVRRIPHRSAPARNPRAAPGLARRWHAIEVLVARDPDDAGPAEAELTSPARLLVEPEIVAAINANAFAHISPPPDNRPGTWRAGDPVNISALGHASGAPGQSTHRQRKLMEFLGDRCTAAHASLRSNRKAPPGWPSPVSHR